MDNMTISHNRMRGVVKSFKHYGRGPDIKDIGKCNCGFTYVSFLEIEVDGQIRDCLVLARVKTDELKRATVDFTVMHEIKNLWIITGVTDQETGVIYDPR